MEIIITPTTYKIIIENYTDRVFRHYEKYCKAKIAAQIVSDGLDINYFDFTHQKVEISSDKINIVTTATLKPEYRNLTAFL